MVAQFAQDPVTGAGGRERAPVVVQDRHERRRAARAARPCAGAGRCRAAGRPRPAASRSCPRSGARSVRRRRGRRPRRGAGGTGPRWRAGRGSAPAADRRAPARRSPSRPPGSGRRRGRRCRRRRARELSWPVPLGEKRTMPGHGPTAPGLGGRAEVPAVRVLAWPLPVRPGWTRRPTRWPASRPRPRTGRPSPPRPGPASPVPSSPRPGSTSSSATCRSAAALGSRWSARHRGPRRTRPGGRSWGGRARCSTCCSPRPGWRARRPPSSTW